MDSWDVLVIGAGPAGLTLACGLRAHGVSVRVMDRATEPASTSRANILHARGVEVLDRLGALGDLAADAVTALTITTYAGGRPISRMRFGDTGLGTSSPALFVSQAAIEAQLRRRLTELDGSVEWNTAIVDAEQDNNGVTVTLHDGHTIRARWLAGCDGAHSTVRKIAGIGFPGAPVADQWLLADVHMDWAMDRSGSHGWLHPDGIFGALPMHHFGSGEDVWRLMAYLPGVTEHKLDDQHVLDQFRQLTPQRTGRADARIRDAVWTSVFRIHRRLADSYRAGRILLVGDAAHIHSPLGGQGMLTGVGDAENLAWKLALVVHGHAGEPLLDTYQAERRPLATGVLRRTSANTRLQVGEGWFVRRLRERIVVPLLNRPAVQRWATRLASQLWVTYRRGPLGSSRFGPKPQPGDRVTDLKCQRANGTATRLYAELGGHWALITPGTTSEPEIPKWLHDRLTVLTPVHSEKDSLLIRPDGHLAWRGDLSSNGLRHWSNTATAKGRTR